jgi:thiamine-phosphate pyrophosphorylase
VKVTGFYGVLDLEDRPDAPVRARELGEQLLAGGASVLQVRMKRAGAGAMLAVARVARELSRRVGVALVVNDRIDVALAAGADGVHLGQDDLPLAAARAVCGGRLAIGISTHTPAQAEAAARAGADYLGFGPVFATRSKENPDPVQGLAALAEAVRRAAPVPIVAIGGVTPERAGEVARAGAAAACAISSVNGAPVVVRAARAITHAFSVS